VEFTSAEEISHVTLETEQTGVRDESKVQKLVFDQQENQDKAETKAPAQSRNGGKATGAQCRALYALSKKAQMGDKDLEDLLRPLSAARFEDLCIADASRLIQYLQTQAAA
jgi:hypothetical protein